MNLIPSVTAPTKSIFINFSLTLSNPNKPATNPTNFVKSIDGKEINVARAVETPAIIASIILSPASNDS